MKIAQPPLLPCLKQVYARLGTQVLYTSDEIHVGIADDGNVLCAVGQRLECVQQQLTDSSVFLVEVHVFLSLLGQGVSDAS